MSRISQTHADSSSAPTTHQRRRLPSTTTASTSSRIFQPLHLDPSSSSHLASPEEGPPESLFRSRLSSNGGGGSGFRERDPTPSTRSQSRRPSQPRAQENGSHAGSGFSRRSNNNKGWESAASESGMSGLSVLSAFPDAFQVSRRKREKRREKEARRLLEDEEREKGVQEEFRKEGEGVDPTDSPLRRWVRWMLGNGASSWDRWKCVIVCLGVTVGVKWIVGLGGYSGKTFNLLFERDLEN